jgi:hypothetical protein
MSSPAFDIFQVQDSGVLWLGSAATVEDAREQVRQIAARAPGKYLLFDQKTGTKLVIELQAAGGNLQLAGAQEITTERDRRPPGSSHNGKPLCRTSSLNRIP